MMQFFQSVAAFTSDPVHVGRWGGLVVLFVVVWRLIDSALAERRPRQRQVNICLFRSSLVVFSLQMLGVSLVTWGGRQLGCYSRAPDIGLLILSMLAVLLGGMFALVVVHHRLVCRVGTALTRSEEMENKLMDWLFVGTVVCVGTVAAVALVAGERVCGVW